MCTGSCSRFIGIALYVLTAVSIICNIILFFPDFSIKFSQDGHITEEVKYMGGLLGGGIIVLIPAIHIHLTSSKGCCNNRCGMFLSIGFAAAGVSGAVYSMSTAALGLANGPLCLWENSENPNPTWGTPFYGNGSYLENTDWWEWCQEPKNVVQFNLTLFSILLVVAGVELVLCLIQMVNGLFGCLCGTCSGDKPPVLEHCALPRRREAADATVCGLFITLILSDDTSVEVSRMCTFTARMKVHKDFICLFFTTQHIGLKVLRCPFVLLKEESGAAGRVACGWQAHGDISRIRQPGKAVECGADDPQPRWHPSRQVGEQAGKYKARLDQTWQLEAQETERCWEAETLERWAVESLEHSVVERLEHWAGERQERWAGERLEHWAGERQERWAGERQERWAGERQERWAGERQERWAGERQERWAGERQERWAGERQERWAVLFLMSSVTVKGDLAPTAPKEVFCNPTESTCGQRTNKLVGSGLGTLNWANKRID
ncbi:Transmembrane 4 L6 family member 4 [Merluccius polli]|uniref:Transmembrane 4 L6 family member 4 n=1 Tax=Merluccius polli TaxID=89951 RepID=A0AA47NP31_MERPO|nr:Transmembrane 4 L6 family member 4 [Merluccius polli]